MALIKWFILIEEAFEALQSVHIKEMSSFPLDYNKNTFLGYIITLYNVLLNELLPDMLVWREFYHP